MKSYPESPENTPPPTPTAPSSGSQHSGKTTAGSLGNGSAGQDLAKTKQRKRKKVSDHFFLFPFFSPFFQCRMEKVFSAYFCSRTSYKKNVICTLF
uniref:Uncharacterized protein n=1 Tax=Suricata suricatta TaxID=37032 RepID=A0A673TCM8_SURSU